MNRKKRYTLKKHEIIKSNIKISEIISSGSKLKSGCLKLFFKKNDKKKVAFCVSKKTGKAVKRNRLKRWLRELYRKNKHKINKNYLMVFMISRMDRQEVTFEKVKENFENIIYKLVNISENNG